MGQKVNPVAFRVGVMEGWKSRWYASKQEFKELLMEDNKVRTFIKTKYKFAAIPKVEIERTRDEVKILLHTARPGVIIVVLRHRTLSVREIAPGHTVACHLV